AAKGSDAARAELQNPAPLGPLLDSSSGSLTGDTGEGGTTMAQPVAASANAHAPWELIGRLWPLLERYAESELSLVSLSLTAPCGAELRQHAETFVRLAMRQPREGALMVVDRREDGGEHFHGIAILATPADARAVWCRLTRAREARCKLTTITGWEHHVAGQ